MNEQNSSPEYVVVGEVWRWRKHVVQRTCTVKKECGGIRKCLRGKIKKWKWEQTFKIWVEYVMLVYLAVE